MKKNNKQSEYSDTIYSQFRSNDNLIDYILGQKGQQSLDRQIIKMMKDMQSDQIIQFSDAFFKFDNNQCESLKNMISKELTSRINFQEGAGGDIKVKCDSQIDQIKYFPTQINNQPRIIKETKQNEQEQDEEIIEKDQCNQIDAICSQVTDLKIHQLQDYKPTVRTDDEYLTGQVQQYIQQPNNEATTIQEDYESDQFDQISRQQLPDGKFRVTYNNNDVYEGEMENDMKNGWGDYYYSTGEKYSGFFQDDEIQGYGRYVFLSGAEYQGDWSSGMKHGMGILKFSNGDVYQGGFTNDMFHGKGEYKYINGDLFKGVWKLGLRNGKGCFEGVDGSIKIGVWGNDKFQV